MKSALVLFLVVGVLMGAGSVRTRDGKTHEGELRLEDGAIVVGTGGAGGEVKVEWANVRQAVLKARPAPKRIVGVANAGLPEGWKSQDIGRVHGRGGARCDEKGVWAIKASGYGAWGPADSFHYAYCTMSGDGQVIARLAKVDDSHGSMVASVMIRQGVEPDAPMAAATIHPSGEVRLSRRPVAPEHQAAGDGASRRWLRLTRRGDVFSAYCSGDGVYWSFVDSHAIAMRDPVLVGLGAWTTSNTSLGQVQMDSAMLVSGTPAATWVESGPAMLEGVVMRDGAAMAGTIKSADEKGVVMVCGGQEKLAPMPDVARIVFNPVRGDASKINGKTGVWLVNGDFIEGEVSGVSPRQVDWSRSPPLHVGIKSVLFGIKYFEAARDVMAVVLGDVKAGVGAFEVRTADGSIQLAKSVSVKKEGVEVDGARVADVVEVIRR